MSDEVEEYPEIDTKAFVAWLANLRKTQHSIPIDVLFVCIRDGLFAKKAKSDKPSPGRNKATNNSEKAEGCTNIALGCE